VYDTDVKNGIKMALVPFYNTYSDYMYSKKMLKKINKYYNSISDGASSRVFYRILKKHKILKK